MNEITGYLELAALNSEMASAYLKDAEDEFFTVAEKLGDCLRLIKELQHQSRVVEHNFKLTSNPTDITFF